MAAGVRQRPSPRARVLHAPGALRAEAAEQQQHGDLIADNCLKQLALFRKCHPSFVEEVARNMVGEVYSPGQTIVSEGAECSSLWIVAQGRVEASTQDGQARVLSEGDSFGEAQILGVRLHATEEMCARTRVNLRVLSRSALDGVLTCHPYERTLFQYMAVVQKLQLQRRQPSSPSDRQARSELQQLEDEKKRLERSLKGCPQGVRLTRSKVPAAAAHRWQSLADWHRQLAASPEGRRLRLWQVEPCPRQPLPLDSVGSELPSDVIDQHLKCCEFLQPTRPASVQTPSARRAEPLSPGNAPSAARPHSTLGAGSIAPSLPAYPQIPRLPPQIPPQIRNGSRRLQGSRRIGGRRPRRLSLPPALGEAVATLSQGLLRARWHCENLHHRTDPDHQSEDCSHAKGGHQQPLDCCMDTTSQGDVVLRAALAAATMGFSDEASVGPLADSQQSGTGGAEDSLYLPAQVLPPRRRLEVTVRGTFRLSREAKQLAEVDEDEDATVENSNNAPRAAETLECLSEDVVRRERMGFGKNEVGAVPSGRSSVPAVRESCSAPPLLGMGADEGIPLVDLESGVERHVWKILERGLRGEPSRAASCEPGVERCISPCPAGCSTPRSLGHTDGLQQQSSEDPLTLQVSLRLCWSRCGSSSAVLELTLDHSAECFEAYGCRCRPSPADAEVQLSAHFARHSLLRLNATQPPVRVLLEPLPDTEERGESEQ